MAGKRRSGAAGEQREAVAEARGDLLDRQQPHPSRGELDRERDAVQLVADLNQRGSVLAAGTEVGAHLGSTFYEQTRCVRALEPLRGLLRQRQRGHPPVALAGDAERRATRGHHSDFGTATEQRFGNGRRLGEQVLAVVERDQCPASRQIVDRGLEIGLGAERSYPHRARRAPARRARDPRAWRARPTMRPPESIRASRPPPAARAASCRNPRLR